MAFKKWCIHPHTCHNSIKYIKHKYIIYIMLSVFYSNLNRHILYLWRDHLSHLRGRTYLLKITLFRRFTSEVLCVKNLIVAYNAISCFTFGLICHYIKSGWQAVGLLLRFSDQKQLKLYCWVYIPSSTNKLYFQKNHAMILILFCWWKGRKLCQAWVNF
jgi:hypothetical protein